MEKKLTFSMQNYLEAVFELSGGGHGVRVSDVAARLGVTKASTTNAMAMLSKKGLATNEKYGEVFLTERGLQAASSTAEKHHVIRRFFTDILHIDPEVADSDACAIEHVISSDSVLAMREFMQSGTNGK